MIRIYGRLAMDGNDVPIVMTETEIFNWLKRHWSTVPRRLLCPPQQLWPSSDQRKQRHSFREIRIVARTLWLQGAAMMNEGVCVCVCGGVGVYVRVSPSVCCVCDFTMAGFATLYGTSGPSWTSNTTATPPILRPPRLRVGLAVFSEVQVTCPSEEAAR